jgi:predicted ATPase
MGRPMRSLLSPTQPSSVSPVLDRITIEGFKSFGSIDVELGRLSLLVGPNGAGKSNFIQVFELLGDIVRGRLQLSVGQAGGASTLLHSTSRRAERIEVKIAFGANGYEVSLVPTADDTLIFEREVPWFHLKAQHPRPYTEALGSGHRESELLSSDLGVPKAVLTQMSRWVVYHFHDTSRSAPVKQKQSIDDNESLRDDARNLAAFLYRLQETDRTAYSRIVDAVRNVAPFFDDFQLRPDRINEGRIQLEWLHRGSDAYFGPDALSDGTLRFICIATLLLQPDPPSLILLDEPELGLHPYAINLVAEMLEACSKQIVVSTQSVTLLNRLDISDVLIADQKDGVTTLTRPDLDALEVWLDEYGLGELWEKNFMGGRPVQR